jgi:hypothetical protein
VAALARAGLEAVRVTQHFDCFRDTPKEKTARKFGVQGANIFARKPEAQTPHRTDA